MGLFNTLIGKVFGSGDSDAKDVVQHDPAQQQRDMIVAARAEIVAAVSARLMCVDINNMVADINPAALAMFHEAQADLRMALPGFTVHALAWASIEVFFSNSGDVLRQIAGLNRPQAELLTLGERTFELLITPVFADDKTRLGTVIEWTDVTLARKLEEAETTRVTNAKRVAAENLRIRIALDHVTSNVMLADKDNRIAYANHAVLEMLRSAEAAIRKDLGNFNSSTIVGISLRTICGRFCRNLSSILCLQR